MDDVELELFESSVRRATGSHSGVALDEALDEIGWLYALEDDATAAVSVLFENQGVANVSSSALDYLLGGIIGTDTENCAVVLPALDKWTPPGTRVGDTITVNGLGTSRMRTSESALIVATTETGETRWAAAVPASALTRRNVEGMDPSLGLVEITGHGITPSSWQPLDDEIWAKAVGAAHTALGYELVGAASTMLELACTHARERVQFDRPIAQFQAVRHRLAETHVGIEGARALLASTWENPTSERKSMAKAVAGRGAKTAARHCQQVLAGIGFTTEHPFHLYLKRVLVLDQLFGSTASLTRNLGRQIVTHRHLPPPLPL